MPTDLQGTEVHNLPITRHKNFVTIGLSILPKDEEQIQSISFFSVIHLSDILNTIRVLTPHNHQSQITLEFPESNVISLTFLTNLSGKCFLVSFLNNRSRALFFRVRIYFTPGAEKNWFFNLWLWRSFRDVISPN